MRFWNNTEKVFRCPIEYKADSKAFYFEDKTKEKKHRILTYRIDVIDAKNQIVEVWKHQFWTKLIKIDQEEPKAEQKR